MFLSKSFGYALRGILYIASTQKDKRKVKIEEIARALSVPRHFLGKILQLIVKAGILHSTKGPYGGFSITNMTLDTPLIDLVEITDGTKDFNLCALQLKNCDEFHSCPLHAEMDSIKNNLKKVLAETAIKDLLVSDKKNFIYSLSIPRRRIS